MIASQEGHQACVELLLDHGADPNMACSNDWPQFPIHAAAEFGHIRYLISLPSFRIYPFSVSFKTYTLILSHTQKTWFYLRKTSDSGCIPISLFLFFLICKPRILQKLIEVTDRTCDRGERMVSPLYVAIHRDQASSIELLLKEGYSPDAQDYTDALGFPSPLSLALHHTSTRPFRCVSSFL